MSYEVITLLLFRSHIVLMEGVLGFVDYVSYQQLIRSDCTQVQVLDLREKLTLHLVTKEGW